MMRKRRFVFLLTGVCIFMFFQLHRRLNSSPPSSPSHDESLVVRGDKKISPAVHSVVEEVKRKETPLIRKVLTKQTARKTLPPQKPATREEDAKTAQRFQKRLEVLKRRCPRWQTSPLRKNWVANKNFLVNYPRRILVCAVPKAGSTSWHMIVWAMRRKLAGLDQDTKFYTYNDTVENHLMAEKLTLRQGKDLITYYEGDEDMFRNPPTEKSRRLLLIRHPFARMISGWHQKFLPKSSYADMMFSRYPRLRRYVSEVDPHHRIAWKDFAKFVADIGVNPQALDYHFTPAWEICKPCDYAYTYILKAESVDQDESWLKRRLNITDIEMGRKGVPPGGSVVNASPSENIKKYMAQLDDRTRRKLYTVYSEDFAMFGYTFDFETLDSGGFE